jgi:hypothetical protein
VAAHRIEHRGGVENADGTRLASELLASVAVPV